MGKDLRVAAARMIEKRYFLLTFRPVRPGLHASMTPAEQALIEQHLLFLSNLQDRGILHFGGRSEDAAFGIAIIEIESREAAQALFDGNPAVIAGIFEGEVAAYHLPLGGEGPRR